MTLANCPMRISLPDPLKSKVSLSFTIKKVYETLNQLILLFIVQFSLHSLFQLFPPPPKYPATHGQGKYSHHLPWRAEGLQRIPQRHGCK